MKSPSLGANITAITRAVTEICLNAYGSNFERSRFGAGGRNFATAAREDVKWVSHKAAVPESVELMANRSLNERIGRFGSVRSQFSNGFVARRKSKSEAPDYRKNCCGRDNPQNGCGRNFHRNRRIAGECVCRKSQKQQAPRGPKRSVPPVRRQFPPMWSEHAIPTLSAPLGIRGRRIDSLSALFTFSGRQHAGTPVTANPEFYRGKLSSQDPAVFGQWKIFFRAQALPARAGGYCTPKP